MKVYIVLEYTDETSRILDVYSSQEGAIQRVRREGDSLGKATLHIIRKSVKGLAGINFEITGKERVLLISNKRKKANVSK